MKILMTLLVMSFMIITVNAGMKDRLAERLPAINKMKEALAIGEDNKGYLAVKGNLSARDHKIVDAENADRKKIYEMLAKKTGASVDKIQARRAAQIAEKSKAGLWLQKLDGTWYKK